MEQVISVTDDENACSDSIFKIKTVMRVFEFQAKDEQERCVACTTIGERCITHLLLCRIKEYLDADTKRGIH